MKKSLGMGHDKARHSNRFADGSDSGKGRILSGIRFPILAAGIALSMWAAQLPPPGSDSNLPPPQPGELAPKSVNPAPNATKSDNEPKIERPVAAGTTDEPTFRSRVRYVLVPTSVFDADGHGYVNGLQAKDFEVLDNDKPQKIETEVTEQPVSVVLVVQANSEVDPLIPTLRNAGLLLQGLVTGQEGDAAILAFDHRKQVLQDFTNDPGKLDDAMHKLTSGSSTAALIDSVMYADNMLKQHDRQNTRRRVIILLSRNVDRGSETRLEEAIHAMQFDNVIVYCVDMSKLKTALLSKPEYPRPANGGVPPEALPPVHGQTQSPTDVAQQQTGNWLNVVPLTARGIRDLFKKTPAEAFSYFTGGEIFNFASNKGLSDAITAIGKDLNSQYLLSYSPNDAQDPGFHHIRVVVDRPGLQVRTRPGYWWGGGQVQ